MFFPADLLANTEETKPNTTKMLNLNTQKINNKPKLYQFNGLFSKTTRVSQYQ